MDYLLHFEILIIKLSIGRIRIWKLLPTIVTAIGSIEGPNFLHSHGDNNVCNNGILCHLMPPWLLFPQPRHLLSPCPIDLQDFNKRLFVTKIWKKSYLAPPDDATPPFSTCVCCVVLGWTRVRRIGLWSPIISDQITIMSDRRSYFSSFCRSWSWVIVDHIFCEWSGNDRRSQNFAKTTNF